MSEIVQGSLVDIGAIECSKCWYKVVKNVLVEGSVVNFGAK